MDNRKILELINQLFKITSSTLNLHQLLNLIMEITLNYLNAEVGSIVLIDKKDGALSSTVTFGLSLEILKSLRWRGGGLLEKTLKEKKAFIITNYRSRLKRDKPLIIRSLLASPLITKGKTLGAIFLVNKTLRGEITNFTEKDLRILKIVNSNIASSIEKALLYEEVLDIKNFNDSIINSISTGVITTDLGGKILSINNSAKFILGLSRDCLHKNIAGILEGIDNRDFLLAALKSKENLLNTESILRAAPAASEKILNISVSVLNNLAQKIIGYAIAIDDITEKKDLENQVTRNDQLAALGELSAGIAHEIKNPLTSIKGFSEMLHDRLDDKEFLLKYSGIIRKETERLNRIIEGMLQFSRPKSRKIERMKLERIIRSARELMDYEFRKNNIRFDMRLGDIPDIFCDASQVEQVFINIFLNAIQAMGQNGTLKVRNRIMIKKAPSKLFFEYNAVSIIDTGKGISQENLNRLFHPFFTTKPNGTGLGLSISHKIITEHKGFMEVFSKPGVGTTFVIYLPTVNN